jgi:diguanylate cyclase (GGDEF)-like protein
LKIPQIPPDEPARLATLRSLNILDTPVEERFDRLTRMAKRVFDVPIALVTLVDKERQWFKSSIGLDIAETPRDISFCGHAILGDDVFVIEDASQDVRFADNPLVVGDPGIRFYAGCPLRALDGSKLGTLCIIDRETRTFGDDDAETLRDLASMIERELAAIQLATVDELTGIANRRGFMSLAQPTLNLCTRERLPASLVFFDLNDFKPINDQFGHAEGDWALRCFADQMEKAFRDADVFARIGGDEFAVLLTNLKQEQAAKMISRLEHTIARFCQKADRGYDITFAFGVVEYDPDVHHGIEALLADGDALMYERKKQNRSPDREA